MDLQLRDRTYVVTAGSRGLGRATAGALVAEGARVVLVARNAEGLQAAAEAMGKDNVAVLAADLADPATARAAAGLALERFGRLDGAFVSVGGPPPGSVLGTTEEQWHFAFDSVFMAALRVARAVVEAATGPVSLGFVLSTSAKSPMPNLAASNGLRPGLAMLVKQLADELGPDRGRTFGLLPGSVATERMHFLWSQSADPAAARQATESAIPLRRSGRPEEFGAIAAFLLSPMAEYVNGCVLPVDGGSMRTL